MIRNLKILGPTLMAVCALSATVAPVSSAQQGTFTSDGSWTGLGTETGEFQNRLTAFGTSVSCPGSSYTIHTQFLTPHGLVPGTATEVTVTPHYKQLDSFGDANCAGPFGWPVTIDMNGCDYEARMGETTGGVAGTYGITFSIRCPIGKEIVATMWTSKEDHTKKPSTSACALSIKEQLGLKGAHAIDTGNGHIDIAGTLEGLDITKTNPGNHGILCQSETTVIGKIDIDITVRGINAAGGSTSISLSHP